MRILLCNPESKNEILGVLKDLDEEYEILLPAERMKDFDILYVKWKELPFRRGEEEVLSVVDENVIGLFFEAIKNYREKVVVTDLDDLKLALSEIERTGDVSLQTRRFLFLKALAYFLNFQSRILKDLSDLFFIKRWEAFVLERIEEEGSEAIVKQLSQKIPEKKSLDISLAVHFLRYLPHGSCILVKDCTVVYASSKGDLPDVSSGVLGYSGTFSGKKNYDFVVAEDFREDTEGIRLNELDTFEEGMVLLGTAGVLREPVPTDNFTEALSMHPAFDCCAVTKDGYLVAHLVELDKSKIFEKLEHLDLSGTSVAFNFPVEESSRKHLKEKGVARISWIDSRRIWRRC
ncbi:hypothetical protein [Thermotoga sp. SG1]|uniref:hypothetical protein n=1 Tax=Thermotoga sp. SG1 TaxID=126739 RepID=UPI000C7945A2|nr:hypothetical protein [Thermotoga sp. SG1]PLV55810.1 hypothetical protein AS006_09290 [Thermotoga sp. SG1]